MSLTPLDLHNMLCVYVRDRAQVVGFHTAIREVQDTVAQLRLYGASHHAHSMPRDATDPRKSYIVNSVGPIL